MEGFFLTAYSNSCVWCQEQNFLSLFVYQDSLWNLETGFYIGLRIWQWNVYFDIFWNVFYSCD